MNKLRVAQLRSAVKVGLLAGDAPAAIADRLGCHRSTVYKIAKLLSGPEQIDDDLRTRNPGRPKLYEESMEETILRARRDAPYLGPRHLYAIMARQARQLGLDEAEVPSPSYIGRVIHRHGLAHKPVGPRDKRLLPDARPTTPGVVTIDTWGPWRLGATPLYLATAQDRFTRFALAVPGTKLEFGQESGQTVGFGSPLWARAIAAVARHLTPNGLERLYADNGVGVAPALGNLPLATRYALSLGAIVVFIPPGQPWRNGRLERFHGTMEHEYFRLERPATLATAQTGLTEWLNYHNQDRPHTAFAYKTPAEANPPGPTLPANYWLHAPVPDKLPPVRGEVHALRLVMNDGTVDTWGQRLALSPALAGQFVRIVFDVTGEMGEGRALYQAQEGEEIVVATFRHTLDANGKTGVHYQLYHDVEPADFLAVPANQVLDSEQDDNQLKRTLKWRG